MTSTTRVELRRHLHGVDRHAKIPVGFLRAIGEDLKVFYLRLDAHLGERLEEITLFPALRLDDIRDGAHENTAANGLFENFRS